tara:strand:+ start:1274 stop:1606 length:333 start_codon:yes stop_codon:yes gene_type:complete
LTGAVHASVGCNPKGDIEFVCGDAGRHNALDKLVGRLCLNENITTGFIISTSRLNYEIAQKALVAGIALIASVSAPTELALEIAEVKNLSVVEFSRSLHHVVYTSRDRIS